MNKRVHRLVFDRRRGMHVPAAEHVRACGKAAGQTRATALATAVAGVLALMGGEGTAWAQTRAEASGSTVGASRFVPAASTRSVADLGQAALAGRTFTLPQEATEATRTATNTVGGYSFDKTSPTLLKVLQDAAHRSIVINWDSFNIGADYSVQFVQPEQGLAINRIWDTNPSVILGRLSGNGEIVLENTNGVVFGSSARVDAGKLVATALKLTQASLDNGIRGIRDGQAAFEFDAKGNNLDAFVSVQRGAEIRALAGGDVILVAPRVQQDGVIETPQGQTVLAAGKTAYLYAPLDLAQRGLLVAVEGFGATSGAPADIGWVENLNRVSADKGSINLVGTAIRQKGVLSATTAVKGENGAVILQAMSSVVNATADEVKKGDGKGFRKVADALGSIELGEGSQITVTPSTEGTSVRQKEVNGQWQTQVVADKAVKEPTAPKADASAEEWATYRANKQRYDTFVAQTQTDSDTFYRSRIDLIGSDITLRSGASIVAPAAEVNVLAAERWNGSSLQSDANGRSEDHSRIVMEAGSRIDVSGVSNLSLPGERQQLLGRLFSIELADSPVQRGGVVYRSDLLADARRAVTVGDVSGLYSGIRRTAMEYSTVGGVVNLKTLGALWLDEQSRLSFAGGGFTIEPAEIKSSIVRQGNQWVRIENASKDIRYDEFVSGGIVTVVPEQWVGMSAGAAVLSGTVMSLGASFDGHVVLGEAQRVSSTQARFDAGLSLDLGLDDQTDAMRAIRRPVELLGSEDVVASPQLYAALRPAAGRLVVGNDMGTTSGESLADTQIGQITVGQVVPTVQRPQAWTEDEWQRLATAFAGKYTLAADKLNEARLGGLSLLAREIRLDGGAEATPLQLAAGGELKAQAQWNIDVNRDVRIQGGTVSLKTLQQLGGPDAKPAETLGDVRVAQGVSIDLSGTRQDERFQTPDPQAGVVLQGGALLIEAARGVDVAAGSELDVSAGVRRSLASTQTGDAGSITLKANQGAREAEALPATVRLQGQVRGHDFSKGGSFTVSGLPTLTLGADDSPFSITALALAGFGTQSFTAWGDVTVARDAKIRPVLRNMVLRTGRQSEDHNALFALGTYVAGLRQGVNLTLSARAEPSPLARAYKDLEQGATLRVMSDSDIDVGTGGSISLSAGRSVEVDGSLTARAGTVNLSVLGRRGAQKDSVTEAELNGWRPEQTIHLGAKAVVDVSGIAKTWLADKSPQLAEGAPPEQESHAGEADGVRVRGEALAGGTVNLGGKAGSTTRGTVVMDQGAKVLLNGSTASVNRGSSPVRSQVHGGGGTLNVVSTDGFVLGGTLEAEGVAASAAGASVNLSISREGLYDVVADGGVSYPAAERQIRVFKTQAEVVTQATTNQKTELKGLGQGLVSTDFLSASGLQRVSLRADDRVVLEPLVTATAAASGAANQATSPQGVSLGATGQQSVWKSLVVNTPVLQLGDALNHTLTAHAVSLGNIDLKPRADQQSPALLNASALAGQGTLDVRAGLIQLHGDSAVVGAASTSLNATLAADGSNSRRDGEVRLVSNGLATSAQPMGSFSHAGRLDITAGQLYAATLSNFTVQGQGTTDLPTSFSLKAPQEGSTSQMPLSALGALTLKESSVHLDGRIAQPFGSITIQDTMALTLGERAELTVSGRGAAMLVGSTLNGSSWYHSLGGVVDAKGNRKDLATLSSGSSATAELLKTLPVAKGISLSGSSLTLSASSVLDASGGGDLKAWEFRAGAGGSTDTYNRKDVFAVLPGYTYDFAPYDAEIVASTANVGTILRAGDQVSIATANDVLAPGRYTLLPARYGMFEGAVLVSATQTNATSALPKQVERDDGSRIVTGQKATVGQPSVMGDDQRVALVLEPYTTHSKKSGIVFTSINQALADAGSGQQPGDAGRISVASTQAFDMLPVIRLGANDGFEAGQLEVSAPNMAIHHGVATGKADVADLQTHLLTGTGAASVLLGGRLTRQGDGTFAVKREAQTVTVDAAGQQGATWQLDSDLLAVATGTVAVKDQLTLASVGADTGAARAWRIQEDGAALLVGQQANTSVSVTPSVPDPKAPKTPVGTLDLRDAAALKGAVVQLDATVSLQLGAATRLDTRSIGLGALRLALGGEEAPADALWIRQGTLATLNQADRVQLRAYSSIDLQGAVTLGSAAMQSLTLDAPNLRGTSAQPLTAPTVASADGAQVLAQNITLTNTTGVAADTSLKGVGSLLVQATPVVSDVRTGGITVATSGASGQRLAFAGSRLQSSGDVVFDGAGALSSQADLTLDASRVSAMSSAAQQVKLDAGKLTIQKTEGGRTLGERLGAGGKLTLAADRIVQNGVIDIESGSLTLQAAGQTGQRDSIVFGEGSLTRVAGQQGAVNANWILATPGGTLVAQAAQGDIVVKGTLDASAPALPAGSDSESVAAGRIVLSAKGVNADATVRGEVRLAETGRILLQGGKTGEAGLGGQLVVDTHALRDDSVTGSNAAAVTAQQVKQGLDRLVAMSRSDNGNALGLVDVRVRRSDLTLGTTLKADQINLTADAVKEDNTLVAGQIVLSETARLEAVSPAGGVIQLQAGGDLTVGHGSQVLAQSTRDGANGGDILLSSTEGTVHLGQALVKANTDADAQDGRVVIRAQRELNGSNETGRMKVAALDTSGTRSPTVQAGQIDLEAVRVYESATRNTLTTGNDTTTAWGLNTLSGHSKAFLTDANKAAVLQQAGLTGSGAHLKSGIEIRHKAGTTGTFNIGAATANAPDLNLATLRDGGEPVQLTVRAEGDIKVNVNVSDGFAAPTKAATNALTPVAVQAGDAASYRWVAGADLSSAQLLATQSDTGKGHLSVAAGKVVRTTAGSIELAASGDVRLLTASNQQGTVYVAGRQATALPTGQTFAATNAWNQFTERGGRMTVQAGRNVAAGAGADGTVAQALLQMPGNFLMHSGGSNTSQQSAWWTAFDSVKSGLGSFGGGNLSVKAGGNISNLLVAAPTNGRDLETSTDPKKSVRKLQVLNGGDVNVQAEGSIEGGVYLLGRGHGRIVAREAIQAGARVGTAAAAGAMLALMDGQWSLQARADLALSQVYNPTLLPSPSKLTNGASFNTYAPGAGVSLTSLSGNVNWQPVKEAFINAHNKTGASAPAEQVSLSVNGTDASGWLSMAPARVTLVSHAGSVSMGSASAADPLWMAPSAQSDLSVFAAQDVTFIGGLTMLDSGQMALPTVSNPSRSANADALSLDDLRKAFDVLREDLVPTSGKTAYRGAQQSAVEDRLQVHAGRDLTFVEKVSTNSAVLRLVREAQLEAGRDMLSPSVITQHGDADDTTRLQAGRNILLAPDKSTEPAIFVSGPGHLDVLAGAQLNLGISSEGIQSLGAAYNQALPDTAAKVTLGAGFNGALNLPRAVSAWGDDAAFRARVLREVQAWLPLPVGVTEWQALPWERTLALFASLSTSHQKAAVQDFLTQRFVAEFMPDQVGREAAWYQSDAFLRAQREVMWQQVQQYADQAVAIAASPDAAEEARRVLQRQDKFAQADRVIDLAGLGQSFDFKGDVNLFASKVHSLAAGGVSSSGAVSDTLGGTDVLTPGGGIFMGLPSASKDPHGFINYQGGSVRMLADADILATDQKVIVLDSGNVMAYTRNGSIDTGKASTTAIVSAPAERRFDSDSGQVVTRRKPTLVGGGIQVRGEGRIGLYAPRGEIRAFDAPVIAPRIDLVTPKFGGDMPANASGLPPAPAVQISLTPPTKLVDTAAGVEQAADSKEGQRKAAGNSLLTVELLSLGDDAGGVPATAAGTQADPVPSREGDAEREREREPARKTEQPAAAPRRP